MSDASFMVPLKKESNSAVAKSAMKKAQSALKPEHNAGIRFRISDEEN